MELSTRQQDIVDKAIGIISRSGIEGLTTKSLAKKVGVSEPALYRHFDGKIDILAAILDYFGSRAKKLLEEVMTLSIPEIEKIHRILKTRSDEFIANPALMVVVLSEEMFPGDSKLSEKVYGIMNLNRDAILRIIEEGQAAGNIRKDIKKETLFYLVLGPFRFIVTRWRLSNLSFDLAKDFDEYWEVIKDILSGKKGS